MLQVTGCRGKKVAGYKLVVVLKNLLYLAFRFSHRAIMNSYRDLEIYKSAFDLAVRVHIVSLTLPNFELYEQGSQIRRSSKSVKDQIVEGYGRRRYKADFIKFLVYAHSSCDEATSQLEMLITIYPEKSEFATLNTEYEILGRKINRFIDYVEKNWKV